MATVTNIDWVHPSIRDVAIEYLMTHDAERERFLRTTSPAGLILGLSSGGGSFGTLSLPLLRRDADWDALESRAVELATALPSKEQVALVRGVMSPLLSEGVQLHERDRQRLRSIVEHCLQTARSRWDAEQRVLEPATLRTYFDSSTLVRVYVPCPELEATWSDARETIEGCADSGGSFDADGLRAVAELLAVLRRSEPRYLRVLGWPQDHDPLVRRLMRAIVDFVDGLSTLDAEETANYEFDDGHTADFPVEPSDEEGSDKDTLDILDDFLRELQYHQSVKDPYFDDALHTRVTDHFADREQRAANWGNGPRSDEDHSDYEKRTVDADTFDIDEFFSDL
jgi:hypothetical protein